MRNQSRKRVKRLTRSTFRNGLQMLSNLDPDLAQVLDAFGPPPIWLREPGFPSLVRIILEQQVSLASANAAFRKLEKWMSPVTPQGFLTLDDRTLRAIGFSRQKSTYCRTLANSIVSGEVDLEVLETLEDDEARQRLIGWYGIGPWTADIYLLMALGRVDIWPEGDLALGIALQEVKELAARPGSKSMGEIAEAWKPYRSVAARILWHHYLSRRDQQSPNPSRG